MAAGGADDRAELVLRQRDGRAEQHRPTELPAVIVRPMSTAAGYVVGAWVAAPFAVRPAARHPRR